MTIKVVTGQQTFVKKIVVGTPISTAQTGLSIDNFSDFKVATKSEGQILVYDSAEQAFKNYDILVGNGLAKEFSPGTDKLLLQIDSDKTPIMTGLTTKGHIVPTADSTFDLGDSAKKFRDLYLSGGTIHLGNIDLKDSSGGFAATDSTGNPVNLNLQGSIPQIRRMFAGGGDLSYDTGTGVFQFDVEQVYTKANFDSDFNVTLDSAVLEGVGLNYSNASNTLNIDSAELESFFKPDIRGYFSASNTLNYNSTTGDFSLPQRLDSTDTPTFSKVTADSASIKELKIPDGGLGNDSARLTIGSDSDLKIFHDGSHSIIRDAGTGSLQLQTNNLSVQNATGTESQITALSGGAVSLFHNNSTKLATTAYGTTITGTVNADSATIPKVSGDSARFTRISGVYQGFDSDLARTTSTQTIRGYVSATDGGGDGSFSYNNSTGVFTYTGPSATEVRSHFSAQGDLSYDSTTGVFQFDVEQVYTKANFDSDFNMALDEAALGGTGISYDSASNTLSIGQPVATTDSVNFASINIADSASIKKIFIPQGQYPFTSGGWIELGGVGALYQFGNNGTFFDMGKSGSGGFGAIRSKQTLIRDRVGSLGRTLAQFDSSGGTQLFHTPADNSTPVKKFETTNYGVTVTGTVNADSATFTNLTRAATVDSAVYGSATKIPVLTVNTSGFIDSIGTVSVAGVDSTSFDSATGIFTINTVDGGTFNTIIADSNFTDHRSRLALTGNKGLVYNNSTGVFDIDSANVRGMVSATDAGGDGSFSYNSGTGVFTYTGPSAAEVKAHFQPLDSSANPTFNQVRGPAEFIIDPAAIGDATGTVKIMGNLQVEGTQTTINSSTIVLKDKNIVIADSAADSSALNGAGLTWGDSAIVSNPTFVYNHANARFVSNREINAPLFSGSGASLTALPAASLTGTIDSARIPALLIADIGNITAIDHDALTNFVANEHIDHTAVSITAGTGLKGGGTIAATRDLAIDSAELYSLYKHDDFSDFVANEHIDHTSVSITAGNGLTGGGTIASTRNLAIDSSQLANLYSKVIVHDNTNGFVANEHIDHTTVSVIAGKGLSGGGTIASNRTIDIDSANVRGMFSGGSGIGDSVNGNGVIKIDSAELYSLYKHDNFADFVADEHVAHTGVSIVAGKGLSGGGNIASSRTIDIDSANIRGMFSAGGDLSYNSGTGQFSFDVEAVYTKENFDSDYFLAKDSANAAVERNAHDATTKTFAVTVASKSGSHVYQGQGSGNAYYIDGTESPIVNLKLGRTYRFNLSSSDMSSHPFRFYYDAARTTQYTTNVSTAATYTEITITEATPPVLHYQCSSHGYMGHAVQISTRNLTGFTTTNLTEGSNLYYTDGRFDTRFAAKTTDNLSEGSSNLYYTDARARAVSLDSTEAQAIIDSNLTNNITFGGDVTFDSAGALLFDKSDKSLKIGENHIAKFGENQDFEIKHTGGNSILKANNGPIFIQSNATNFGVHIGKLNASETMAKFIPDNQVELYYNNLKRLVTGIDNVQILNEGGGASRLKVSSNNNTIGTNAAAVELYAHFFRKAGLSIFGDSIGASSPTEEWFIGRPYGTSAQPLHITSNTSGQKAAVFNQLGSVELYYNNSKKIETTDSGVTVTGEIIADSAVIGGLRFPKTDGLNNQVIKTDGAGNLSFISVAAISGAIDSENVINLIDSAYVAARSSGGTDSAATQAMIDSNFTNMDIDLHMPDNQKITFGNDSDLKIFHNGSNSLIQNSGTGAIIHMSDVHSFRNAANTEQLATFVGNGKVELYHNNVLRLDTLDSGVNITGNLRVNNAPFTSGITVQEEGSSLSTAGTTLNFVGDAVTATGSGATKTITITSSSLSVGTLNNVKADAFVGNNSNKTFTLSNAPADSDDVLIFINGILQHTNTYSISGDTVTLDSAPDSASEIEARTHLIQSTNIVLRDHKSYVYTLSTTTDSVSGPDSAGVTLAYDVGKVDVFANGSRLVTGKDFTAGNGTSIVFDSAFSSGNVIEVVSHAKAAVADINGIIAIDSDLTTTGANQIIHTFNATTHRTFKFTAQIEHDSSSSYHAEEVLLTHNGTTVAMTTYAQVLLDSNLGTFDADINSGIVRLKFSPTKTNTSIKLRAIRTTA